MKQTLTFHRIEPRFTWSVSNYSPARFRDLISRLNDHAPNGIRDSIQLTFDDAYESVYQFAAPVLAEFGLTATIFVPTAFIGQSNRWDYTRTIAPTRHMRVVQLRELSELGYSVQSHTHTHVDLSTHSEQRIADELRISRDILEQSIGREVTEIAFPYGSFNKTVEELASQAGYTRGWGMNPARSGAFTVGRWPVYSFDTALSVSHKRLSSPLSALESAKAQLISRLSRLNRYAFWAEQPDVTQYEDAHSSVPLS